MLDWVNFGEIVGWCPRNAEMTLVCAIANPMEAHVHSFGVSLLDRAICYAYGVEIVRYHGCGLLRIAEESMLSAIFPFMKRAAYSASIAPETTDLMTWLMTSMAPLMRSSLWLER